MTADRDAWRQHAVVGAAVALLPDHLADRLAAGPPDDMAALRIAVGMISRADPADAAALSAAADTALAAAVGSATVDALARVGAATVAALPAGAADRLAAAAAAAARDHMTAARTDIAAAAHAHDERAEAAS